MLNINGHTGTFYFHPRLIYDSGDWEETFVPQTSSDTKIIDIPAAWLRRGENRLVLTALDDPPQSNSLSAQSLPGTPESFTTRWNFPCRRTRLTTSIKFPSQRSPRFFTNKTPDGPREIVEVIASFAAMPSQGAVEFQLAGQSYRQEFQSQRSNSANYASNSKFPNGPPPPPPTPPQTPQSRSQCGAGETPAFPFTSHRCEKMDHLHHSRTSISISASPIIPLP